MNHKSNNVKRNVKKIDEKSFVVKVEKNQKNQKAKKQGKNLINVLFKSRESERKTFN